MSTDPPTETDGRDAEPDEETRRSAVRHRYGSIAENGRLRGTDPDEDCCGGSTTTASSCCSDDSSAEASRRSHAEVLGYEPGDLERAPAEAELGLGCGNPTAIAGLEPGETVVDLGSGGGFDCFLAAEEVRPDGRVIGVDMTPEMVARARRNAERHGEDIVEFRLGEIEHLPIRDGAADVIISNCVINLSPAKAQVFAEAYRVLKPGGRLAISDIVTTPEGRDLLDRTDLDQLSSCIAGAATIERLTAIAEQAGFESVSVEPKEESEEIIAAMFENEELYGALHSARIEATKPPR